MQYSWLSYQILVGIYTKVYFWALDSVSPVYVTIFIPIPYCFDYFSFVVEFEIRNCVTSSSVILSQDCFGYSVFLGSTLILGLFFCLYKMPLEFDRECIESVDLFG